MFLSKLYNSIIIAGVSCLPIFGSAQNNISATSISEPLNSVRETEIYLQYFKRLTPFNVISTLNEYNSNFSQVQTGYQHSEASLPIDAQLGTGVEQMFFKAQSHIKVGKNSIAWGEAYYENGKRLGVSWNLNSDYKRVFPYVTADTTTVSMLREYYRFRGGYAHKQNKLTLGAELSYQSTIEYRNRDPRPKNTSLDVLLRLGLGYDVLPQRVVAMYVDAGRYTQQSNVIFMNPQGNRVLYHLTGLGMQYFRFKGLQNAVKYEGNNYLIGISTHTKSGNGLQASADMSHENIQKRLASERDIPICDIFQTKWRGDISWIKQQKLWTYKLMLNAEIVKREGQERFYDSGLTNYKQIASSKPFLFQQQIVQLSFATLHQFSPATWFVLQPNVAYDVQNTQYLMPVRQLKTAFIVPSLQLKFSQMFSKSLLAASVSSHFGKATHHHFVFNEPEVFDKPVEMFRNNAAMQQANYWDLEIQLRYDIRLIKVLSSVFVQLQTGHRWYNNNQNWNNIELSMGVTL
ncbi:DUF6850 family outer membrane beta-barrel protein [Prevotella pallens]|uniref:DUF6850 family outer membrane beta-barrel protein n=1 Tax=Prevotella pallens TaxID=60133 RepID=UPI0028ED6682|nr:DUF6850 family outer membrane beta-barrel protein [Prevotella pallens]